MAGPNKYLGASWMLAVLPLLCAGSAPVFDQAQQAPDNDIMILASRLRHVTIAYSAKGPMMASCEVRTGSDARVLDQMMCSILQSCLPGNWSGISRMTRCVNGRVDALEASVGRSAAAMSPFPDEWLAQGYEPTRTASSVGLPERTAAVRAGRWVFTEMAMTTGSDGRTGPTLLRWQKCIAPAEAATGLATLLEPPPYTAGARAVLPPGCRDWKIAAANNRFSGDMACKAPSGASATGKLTGEIAGDRLSFHRQRTWRKPGAWAEARFDTSAVRDGDCSKD